MKLVDLIATYVVDADSPIHTLRHVTKQGYLRLLKRLDTDLGARDLATLKAREIKHQHDAWVSGGQIAMGHSLMTMLRITVGFGASILEDEDCQRLRGLLSGLRFKNAGRRTVWLDASQSEDVRDAAILRNYFAMALAQALQSDTALRQKDCIGEWIPVERPEPSTIFSPDGKEKWVRGVTAEEVDADMILTHKTSKRGRVLSFDLKGCQAVMEEWFIAPSSGPLVIDPETDLPYQAWKFRRIWRDLAMQVGIPKGVRNMDSRAGRITQAFADGANPNDIRLFAGHNNLATTMGYARGSEDAIGRVLGKREAGA